MNNNTIDFTVLMPVYNTIGTALLDAVESLFKQTINQGFEILIVDDGSTAADTYNALNFLQNNPRITVVTCPENKGTSNALNIGHDLIKTEWIAIMGSDDISKPERFEKQVSHLLQNPDIDVLGTNLSCFYHENNKDKITFYSTKKPYAETLDVQTYGWLTNHGTVMYKNQSVKDVGGYDVAFARGQDVDLWKRMYNAGKIIRTLEDNLYLWRRFRNK